MSEINEPFGEITIDSEIVPLTRDNFELYSYIGMNALYNHCYIKRPQGGAYIWSHLPAYKKYAEMAVNNKVPMILNLTEPTKADRDFYIEHASDGMERLDDVAKVWAEEQAGI